MNVGQVYVPALQEALARQEAIAARQAQAVKKHMPCRVLEAPAKWIPGPEQHNQHFLDFIGYLQSELAGKQPIREIQRAVAKHFGVRVSAIISSSRTSEVILPRHIAMYLCRLLTIHSLPVIGRSFGGRDHTTVLHAVRKIEDLREQDPEVDRDVRRIMAMFPQEEEI